MDMHNGSTVSFLTSRFGGTLWQRRNIQVSDRFASDAEIHSRGAGGQTARGVLFHNYYLRFI